MQVSVITARIDGRSGSYSIIEVDYFDLLKLTFMQTFNNLLKRLAYIRKRSV